jgi:hypothetical protein
MVAMLDADRSEKDDRQPVRQTAADDGQREE